MLRVITITMGFASILLAIIMLITKATWSKFAMIVCFVLFFLFGGINWIWSKITGGGAESGSI